MRPAVVLITASLVSIFAASCTLRPLSPDSPEIIAGNQDRDNLFKADVFYNREGAGDMSFTITAYDTNLLVITVERYDFRDTKVSLYLSYEDKYKDLFAAHRTLFSGDPQLFIQFPPPAGDEPPTGTWQNVSLVYRDGGSRQVTDRALLGRLEGFERFVADNMNCAY